MQLDLSAVPRLAERQAVDAMLEAKEAINYERIQAIKHLLQQSAKRRKAFGQEVAPLRQALDEACQRLDQDLEAIDDQIAELGQPYLERMDLIDDQIAEQHPDVDMGHDDEPRRCSVSGLVLFNKDDLWRHHKHGVALMALFQPADFEPVRDDAETASTPAASVQDAISEAAE